MDARAPLGSETICISADETFVAVVLLIAVGMILSIAVDVGVARSGVDVGGTKVVVLVAAMEIVSGVGVGAGSAVAHPTNNKTTTNQIALKNCLLLTISPTSFASNQCARQSCLT
jgi:hypothetical protein